MVWCNSSWLVLIGLEYVEKLVSVIPRLLNIFISLLLIIFIMSFMEKVVLEMKM